MMTLLQAFGQVAPAVGATNGFLALIWVMRAIVFTILVLYLFFAVRVWVQVKRLERWLPILQGHGFSWVALIHLGLAMLGVILSFFLL